MAHDRENLDNLEEAIERYLEEEAVEKDNPGSSQVHVPAPMGGEEEYAENARSRRMVPPEVDNLNTEVLKAISDNDHADLEDMQRLVEGVDWEMANNTNGDEEQALINAQDCLADDLDYYREKIAEANSTSDDLAKSNDNHDDKGQFSSGGGSGKGSEGSSKSPDFRVASEHGKNFLRDKNTGEELHRTEHGLFSNREGSKFGMPPSHPNSPFKKSVSKDTQENEDENTSNWPVGFNLDLGSGQAREAGHVGIDTYPYDYGTYVHDLSLGIPCGDQTVSKVRLANVEMQDKDLKPLLSEIQRVLMPGGQFHYEGPNDIWNYPEIDNGKFELVHQESNVSKAEGLPYRSQTLQRLAVPDPATADDAEPRIGISQYDQLPADALLAMDALGYYWSDSTSSGRGNRLHGYPSQGALLSRQEENEANNVAKELTDDDVRNAVDEPQENDYALPDERRYPINDINQAVAALSACAGRAEEENVKNAVYRKFPSLKGDVTDRGHSMEGLGELFRVLAGLVSVGKSDSGRNVAIHKHQAVRKAMAKKGVVPIAKIARKKQIAYCVVLSPDELDAQDDWMTSEDIEDAAHSYMANSRVIGKNHEKPIDATPVESYIAPQDLEWDSGPYGPQTVKKGSWILGIKVHDPKEWAMVENGDYQGVSVGGLGLRE